jgi:hypothetical protein
VKETAASKFIAGAILGTLKEAAAYKGHCRCERAAWK